MGASDNPVRTLEPVQGAGEVVAIAARSRTIALVRRNAGLVAGHHLRPRVGHIALAVQRGIHSRIVAIDVVEGC